MLVPRVGRSPTRQPQYRLGDIRRFSDPLALDQLQQFGLGFRVIPGFALVGRYLMEIDDPGECVLVDTEILRMLMCG
jgi:hypothetical protein